MNGSHAPDDGVPYAHPDPASLAHGDPKPPTPPPMYSVESPMTKFKFQAKIDVNRNRTEKMPIHLKALLIEFLTQHQNVDPSRTFHLLPTNDKYTTGVTKANEIPNNEAMIKQYVKEMHDVENATTTSTTQLFFTLRLRVP
jgi:hypothetical protein